MLPELTDRDRQFALLHVAALRRSPVHAIWALDEALGHIVAGSRDVLIGQMRLTWWYEAVAALREGERRGQPILDALADQPEIDKAGLTLIVEGWEALLDPLPLGCDALLAYATKRGGTLFDLTAALTGGRRDIKAGEGWALADFANRCSDGKTRERAWNLAEERHVSLPTGLGRPLRIISRLAQADALTRSRVERTRWRLLRASW